jgi:hypothetical protein
VSPLKGCHPSRILFFDLLAVNLVCARGTQAGGYREREKDRRRVKFAPPTMCVRGVCVSFMQQWVGGEQRVVFPNARPLPSNPFYIYKLLASLIRCL